MKKSESASNLAKRHRKCGSGHGYLLPAFISALAALIFFCVGVTAQAATITVNSSAGTLTDSGKCTLRGAVSSVNAGSNQNNCAAVVSPDAYGSNDTITFDTTVFSAATTIMVSPEITITKSLTIDGALDGNGDPLITLNGNNANRILSGMNNVSRAVSGLIFRNGSASTFGGGAILFIGTTNISNSVFNNNSSGSNSGGAIFTMGTVNIDNSVFNGNRANVMHGGAIFANAVNVSNSVFARNYAGGNGGAITTDALSGVNISDSVFDGNEAGGYGGAVNTGALTNISNSTFVDNRVVTGSGGAIAFEGTTLEARHLTLLNNSAATSGATIYVSAGSGNIDNSLILSSVELVDAPTLCAVAGAGSIDGSYNIEWVDGVDVASPSCGTTNRVLAGSGAIGTIVETTLADNGGPTPTLALPTGSPAIGAVDPGGATSQMLVIDFAQTSVTATWEDATLDQRGVARATTAADRSIGAFEKAPSPPPPVNAAPIPVLPASLVFLLALGLAGIGLRKLKVAKS